MRGMHVTIFTAYLFDEEGTFTSLKRMVIDVQNDCIAPHFS